MSAASRRFLAPRNALDQRHLMASMKAEALGEGADVSTDERRAIVAARTLGEFDEHYVAPRNGWSGAEAYYAANSALGLLS